MNYRDHREKKNKKHFKKIRDNAENNTVVATADINEDEKKKNYRL